MRKMYLGALCAVLALAGCEVQDINGNHPFSGPKSIPFELSASVDATKTTIDGSWHMAWEEGDKIYAATTDAEWGASKNDDAEGTTIAEFTLYGGTFTTSSEITDGEHTFNFIYAREDQKIDHRGGRTYFRLLTEQNQNCSAPTAHLKENDALIGNITATTPAGHLTLAMDHLFCMMKVTIKNQTGEALNITRFQMSAPGAVLAGKGIVHFDSADPINLNTNPSPFVAVNLEGGSVASGSTLPVYFVFAPIANYSGTITFRATDSEGNTYTLTNTVAGLTFTAGTYNTASFTLKEADAIPEPMDATDVITKDKLAATAGTYVAFSDVKVTTNALYTGNTATSDGAVQMSQRSGEGKYYGIVSTVSGGYIRNISVTWNGKTGNGNTLDIYGSNTAYSSITDLYDENKKGTKIGSIVNGTSTEFEVEGSYRYVGICSHAYALYLDNISFEWGITAPNDAKIVEYSSTGWLELPAQYSKPAISGTTPSHLNNLYQITHYAEMNGEDQRNYTFLYDPEMYTSYWVAYPLCSNHLGGGRDESWAFDPSIPVGEQTKLSNGAYKVNVGSINSDDYDKDANFYSRGHQIPNADRNGVDAMMAQTYYSTNITPQIQVGFNGDIWRLLEDGVRDCIPDGDTLYVVTGAAFRKSGGSETVTWITSYRDHKSLPLPNYYWKVVLKVKRSGNSITNAKAIGFWLPHDVLTGHKFTEYVTSVDQIEEWTGFNFFDSLPDELESTAETNTNWSGFQYF